MARTRTARRAYGWGWLNGKTRTRDGDCTTWMSGSDAAHFAQLHGSHWTTDNLASDADREQYQRTPVRSRRTRRAA